VRNCNMKFSFRNLLGTVYHSGNLAFTSDGFNLFSPVGNKVSVFDLKSNLSETLPVESRFNITALALSPSGTLLVTANEEGEVSLISLLHARLLCSHRLNGHVRHIAFSPNGNHGDSIVSVRFRQDNSLDLLSVSRNGRLCFWKSSLDMKHLDSKGALDEEEDKKDAKIFYTRQARHYLGDLVLDSEGKRVQGATLTAADYCARIKVLVTGFSTGAFFIHEVSIDSIQGEGDSLTMIHSLSFSTSGAISSLAFTPSGEWVAIASEDTGTLAVWEWASETFILKQEGEFNMFTHVVFSPDGSKMATGSENGHVKLWSYNDGFCFQTFREHSTSVTGLCFGGAEGKIVVSASADGSVRAFDLIRYRNFRTFTSPTPAQFSCVAVDLAAELVAAGAEDTFDAYLWSVKTGSLLEVLSGHEGPVSCLAFSPSPVTATKMVTGSWDHTLRLWEPATSATSEETMTLSSEVLSVVWRPDARELAVATLDGRITFFDPVQMKESGSIEGRKDLGVGLSSTDLITKEKVREGKAFKTISYSADGESLLAAGDGKFICLYNVAEALLVDRFQVTQNYSFGGMLDFVSKRMRARKPEMDDREKDLSGGVEKRVVLPGSRMRDMTARTQRPEVRVSSVAFSPTGRAWSATTSEGLLLFSSDPRNNLFRPIHLEENVTPESVRQALADKEYGTALDHAFKLNEASLLQEVTDAIPAAEIEVMCSTLTQKHVLRLLSFAALQLESSRQVELYLRWIHALMSSHALALKGFSRPGKLQEVVHALQKALARKRDQLTSLSEHNKYMIRYLSRFKTDEEKMEEDDDDDGEDVPNEESD
ncbi:unnamed protein product, partial [Cyprideis torosa]